MVFERRGRFVGKLLDQRALLGRRQRRRRDGVLEDRDRVRLQRVHGDPVGAEEGSDLLALHRRAVPPRLARADRPRRLREEGQVLRAAAAADRAAAAVEEVDAHVGGGAGGEDGLLGAVKLPERRELAGVLRRVRVAEHHLMRRRAAEVRRRREDGRHHGGRRLEVVARLEEGRHAHRRLDAARLLQQLDGEDVGGAVGHRDDVRAQALARQLGVDGERCEHLVHLVARGEVRRQQRPLEASSASIHWQRASSSQLK